MPSEDRQRSSGSIGDRRGAAAPAGGNDDTADVTALRVEQVQLGERKDQGVRVLPTKPTTRGFDPAAGVRIDWKTAADE